MDELTPEFARMSFCGWEEGCVSGDTGHRACEDVNLIRHAYSNLIGCNRERVYVILRDKFEQPYLKAIVCFLNTR